MARGDRSAPEDLVRRFMELAWNQGDEEVAAGLLATEFAHHDLVTDVESDAANYLQSILGLRSAFSAIEVQIHETIASDGRVAYRWTAVGTQAVTGVTVAIDGMSIDHVAEGRIVENWTVWDRARLESQLPDLLRPGKDGAQEGG
ncbi:MAG: ester cyclase [Acidimicrobiia bacterium]